MPRYTARERLSRYEREYAFQKKTGKPFFPYAVFHDTVTGLVAVLVILGLTLLWHSGFGPVPDDISAERTGGFLGPAYEARADPAVEEYDPRPEWYYFFLFELLRIFKTPELLLFGSVIVPTILMVLLIAWPFLDRRPERRISRRPIAMTIGAAVPIVLLALTWYGSKAPGAGAAPSTKPGGALFATSGLGCAGCHTLADAGAGASVGPNLDSLKPDYETVFNAVTNGKGAMPSFGSQPEASRQCVAGYVVSATGGTPPADVYPAACG